MSKAFTFDLDSVEIANKSKLKADDCLSKFVKEGELVQLINKLEKLLFKIVECDETRDGRNRKDLIYEASILYWKIMEFASLLNALNANREIAINLAGLYFSIDFGIVKNVPSHLLAPNGSLFKTVVEHIAEPEVIYFTYILKEKVVKRPPPIYG